MRVTRVGKDLAAPDSHGEAIGFSLYRGRGPELFTDAIDEILSEAEGSRRWYLSAVNLLAGRGQVRAVGIEGAGFAGDRLSAGSSAGAARWSRRSGRRCRVVAAGRWGRTDGSGAGHEEAVLREALPANGDR